MNGKKMSHSTVAVIAAMLLLAIANRTWGDDLEKFKKLDAQCWAQMRAGKYQAAERLALELRELAKGPLADQPERLADAYNTLGALYHNQGRYAEAEPLYQQSLKIRRKVLGEEHPDVAASLNNLAILYGNQGRYAEAEPLLEKARRIAAEGRCDPLLVARIHGVQADVFWKTDRRERAAAELDKSLAALEQQRAQASGGELERAGFFAGWAFLFEKMVAWQQELGDASESLRAMERGRARGLVDQMATAGMDLLAGVPEEQARTLRGQEGQAKTRSERLRKQLDMLATRKDLSREQRKAEGDRLVAELRAARAEYARAYADIRNASPAYRLAVGADLKPAPLEKLQPWAAGRGALVLEYLLGSEAGYVLIVSGGGKPRVETLSVNKEQAALLGIEPGPLTGKQIQAALSNEKETGLLQRLKDSEQPEKAKDAVAGLSVLWKLLIPESERKALLEGKFKRLIVLPNGPLARLPFETLVVEPGIFPSYLLDAGPPIQYAPSATILINLTERKAASGTGGREPVLTVGNCRYGRPSEPDPGDVLAQISTRSLYSTFGGSQNALPYSAWESGWVVDVFKEYGFASVRLEGAEATEANVRKQSTGREVVHLACHGLASEEYGNLFGALAVTPGPDTTNTADDGFLRLSEIYALKLEGCELAILSACETNVGPQQRGEGVWAISRGFLVSGARRVVASNWLVDDEAAASLVSYFCSIVAR